jgi:hypothetical protein
MAATGLLFILLFCLATVAYAQTAADSLWLQSLGGMSDEHAAAIRPCADHGYLIIGSRVHSGPDGMTVARMDSAGHLRWFRTYTQHGIMTARDAQPLADGGFIIAGSTSDVNAGKDRTCLIRINDEGDTLWSRIYYRNESDGANAVRPTEDGGFILGGWTVSMGSSGMDICVMKTDSLGGVIWYKTYGGPGDEWASDVSPTRDGGYVLSGQSNGLGGRIPTLCLLKADSAGNLLWFRRNVNAGLERVYNVAATEDGGYVVSGTLSTNWERHRTYVCLYRMDSDGDLSWFQRYVLFRVSTEHLTLRVPDYGFIVGTYTFSLGDGPRELGVIKASHDGELLANGVYSGAGYSKWASDEWYWSWQSAESFGKGLKELFWGQNVPIKEEITIRPPMPVPERSERHEPYDSFSNAWTVYFALKERQNVKITLYDSVGEPVRTLADHEYCTGKHSEILDGWTLPAGIYFVRAETKNLTEMQKVVMIR